MTTGLGDFSPGVLSMRAAGIAVTVQPYAGGTEGIKASLETMAQKIREGRNDAAVVGWARGILKSKGLDGRDRPGVKQQVGAILDELRASTIYAPDPYGTEMIASAGATLCLRPGLCLNGGDCFVEGTKLLHWTETSSVLVPIELIGVGQRIWGRDGWTAVRATVAKGALGYAEIHLDNGRPPIGLTHDHWVYVEDSGEYDRVRVRDLAVGDRLLQPRYIQWFNNRATEYACTDKSVPMREVHVTKITQKLPRLCWDIETEDHYVYLPEHDVTVSNCDDLSVALGSATLSLGIPTMIVKQNFGKDAQEHVLIAVRDESGDWLYADPSTKMPMGSALHANSEVWVDPMEPVGNMPEAQAQLVTLGRPRHIERHGSAWWEHAHGEWWRHDGGGWQRGLGAPPSVVGVTAGTPWQQVTDGSIKSGLRYQIKFVIDEVQRAGDTPPTTAEIKTSLQSRFANDFLLETLDPTQDVTGGVQSWLLVGVAINNRVLQDDPPGMGSISFTSIAVQAQAPSTPAIIPDPTPPAAPPTTSYVSAGTVAVGALAVATVGGVAWGMYRRHKKARR
jgi:hypothetical protein